MAPGISRRSWVVSIALGLLCVILFWRCLPSPLFREPGSWVIEDSRGGLLGAAVASDGQWRMPGRGKLPYRFAASVICFEDKRFLEHPGVDGLSVIRAIGQNIGRGRVVSGASTITMQVARLTRARPRTFLNKIREAVMALRLEVGFDKAEILSMYAEHAPFGGNIVGLDAAAWRYYGKSPEMLSWGEMAALAVIPNSPSLVNPSRNRAELQRKRDMLLDALQRGGFITATDRELAKLEPLPGAPKALPQLAPHLLQRARLEGGEQARNTRITTTIDRELQVQVSDIIDRRHRELSANGIHNLSALVLDVETGHALAYVGNVREPEHPEWQTQVDMITARRSPGSTLKPLLYAAMLSDGLELPHALVPDIPTEIAGFIPRNFDEQFDGAVPASQALSRSLNVPAVRQLQQYQYPRFHALLKDCGISTLDREADHYGLSLILGGAEVSMWDLGGMYASLARAYVHQQSTGGKIMSDAFHAPSYSKAVSTKKKVSLQVPLDPGSLWFTFQAMEEVMRPGDEGLWQQFSSSKRIAWKTGTSFGFRDAWAVGLTPRYVVVVWAGNAGGEGRPGLIGVQAAAPVMFDIFRTLPDGPWFNEPSFGTTLSVVCRESGFRASVDCPHQDTVRVQLAGVKSPACPYHKMLHLDAKGMQVNMDCAGTGQMRDSAWFVLPPAMEWYYRQHHIAYSDLPAFASGCELAPGSRRMDIIYPQYGAHVRIPVEIDGRKGRVVFRAAHRDPDAKIFWHLDDEYVATTTRFHELSLDPPPGRHFLTLVDEKGERITRPFEVEGALK